VAFWLKNKGKMQGNNFQIDKEPLMDIPLINPLESIQEPIIELLLEIHSIISSNGYQLNSEALSQIKILENNIDSLVYNMYGLSQKEIALVEECLYS
jgi:adenine-specific DNA-methyltransferase